MRDLIKKILREDVKPEKFQSINYGSLSQDEKESIKSKGVQVFDRFKLADYNKLNGFFKDHGLFYGAPSEEYLEKNIEDIEFALTNLPLSDGNREKLINKKIDLKNQYESIQKFNKKELPTKGRYFEFFQEIPKSEQEKMVWSIVNLFDNNIMVWIKLINDWLTTAKRRKKITSISGLINHYFSIQNGDKAFKDLVYAMVDRANHNENIIKKTWGGGQEVEQKFKSKLLSNGFNENDIHIFSGEKNIVDGVGIDLAVNCDGKWIPIQVKSGEKDASYSIPFQGFSTFPYENTFKLISKLKGNNVQRNVSELCKPLNKAVEDKIISRIPANVDYVGHMGWDKDFDN